MIWTQTLFLSGEQFSFLAGERPVYFYIKSTRHSRMTSLFNILWLNVLPVLFTSDVR